MKNKKGFTEVTLIIAFVVITGGLVAVNKTTGHKTLKSFLQSIVNR